MSPPASIPSPAMPPSTPSRFSSPSPPALPPIPSPSPTPVPSLDLPPLAVGLIAGIIGGVLLCVVFVPCLVLHIINKWHQDRDRVSSSPSEAIPCESFKYDDLASATNGFADRKVLGQGAFGAVYQGTLNDGKEVAINKLNPDGHQGEQEFRAEVDIISRVHHRNLVRLIGYCIHDNQRLLVYEFAPNKTLRFHLHESDRPIDWPKRWKIALGVAKGLAYLHENCQFQITGKKPVMLENQGLVFWVRTLLSAVIKNEKFYDELIDKRLENNYDQECMTRLIECAAAAVRCTPHMRPAMCQIVRYLEGKITLRELHAGSMSSTSAEVNSLELEALRRMAWGNGANIEDDAD